MITDADEIATRTKEAQLPKSLSHPNIVVTFQSRTTLITEANCEQLRKDLAAQEVQVPRLPSEDPALDYCFDMHAPAARPVCKQRVLEHCGIAPGKYASVIVMELCDKGTLLNAIDAHVFTAHPQRRWSARIGLRAMLRTALEICRGLEHIHSCGIVHGDLKPANVLLGDAKLDRRGFTAKLTDFGLSHVVGGLSHSLHTDTWGTPHYMAPQHFDGRVSYACDVYSFGAVLLQMVTGQQPYQDVPVQHIVDGVVRGKLQPVWPADHPIPALTQLGARMTAYHTDERPPLPEVHAALMAIDESLRRLAKPAAEAAASASAVAETAPSWQA